MVGCLSMSLGRLQQLVLLYFWSHEIQPIPARTQISSGKSRYYQSFSRFLRRYECLGETFRCALWWSLWHSNRASNNLKEFWRSKRLEHKFEWTTKVISLCGKQWKGFNSHIDENWSNHLVEGNLFPLIMPRSDHFPKSNLNMLLRMYSICLNSSFPWRIRFNRFSPQSPYNLFRSLSLLQLPLDTPFSTSCQALTLFRPQLIKQIPLIPPSLKPNPWKSFVRSHNLSQIKLEEKQMKLMIWCRQLWRFSRKMRLWLRTWWIRNGLSFVQRYSNRLNFVKDMHISTRESLRQRWFKRAQSSKHTWSKQSSDN